MSTATLNDETVQKVLRQVEFYFGDSNLPRDNFLKKSISESEDGMVSLALICSFSRMRSHLNLGEVKPDGVSEDTVKAVADVLRRSSLLKVSEDGKKIGRATELPKPEEVIEQLDARTVAASPLSYDTNIEDVEAFFGQEAKVNSVRLPRHVADKKLFCGTALIEFASEEDAEKVLKQNLVYAGVDLELKQKKDFDAKRATEAEEAHKLRSIASSTHAKSSNAVVNIYPKGLIVSFTLKKMLAGGSQEQSSDTEVANDNDDGCKTNGKLDSTESLSAEMVDVPTNENNNKSKENHEENNNTSLKIDDEKTSSESAANENKEGVVLKDEEKVTAEGSFDAAACKDNKDIVMREDLKEVFKKFGTVKFVDFKIGSEEGYIRFEGPEAAQKARAAAVLAKEGGLIVKNYVAALEPVTGDAESDYWSLVRGNQERHRDNKGGRGRGGKQGRGGRQFHGKQARSREHDSPSDRPNKAQKVAASE